MNLLLRLRNLAAIAVTVLLALSLVHCGDSAHRATMPSSLAGGWARENVETVDAERVPESLRRLGATSGQQTAYVQQGRKIPVSVYALPSGTAAFEAQQTYPRTADEYFFTLGASFVIIDASGLPNDERRPFLMAFVEAAKPKEASQKQE